MLMASYTPLAKIFQPFFSVYERRNGKLVETELVTQDMLLRAPDRVFKKEIFSITIQRSIGTIRMISGQPMDIADPDVWQWLCPPQGQPENQETDPYGVVDVRLDPEVQSAIAYFATTSTDTIPEELARQMRAAHDDGMARSKAKVMKQIRYLHDCLRKQYQSSDEQKLGRHDPSPVEYLCTYVLNEELMQDSEEKARIRQQFHELFQKIV
jgi:hypothetical protein